MPGSSLDRFAITLVALGAVASEARSQDVYVVDAANGPGTDYQVLWEATYYAPDDSVVLVRSGVHEGPVFAYRAITVVAEPGGLVHVTEHPSIYEIEVRDTDPDECVILQGLSTNLRLRVENCQGPVIVEDCLFERNAIISNSSDVVIARCSFGGLLDWGSTDSGAVSVRDSVVHIYDSVCLGGTYQYAPSPYGGPGDAGILIENSTVYSARNVFAGGDGGEGGSGDIYDSCPGGIGGSAIELSGSHAELHSFDDELLPGSAGPHGDDDCGFLLPPSADGVEISIPPAGSFSVDQFGGKARGFSATSPVLAGTGTLIQADGLPGDAVFALLSPVVSSSPFPGAVGDLLVDTAQVDFLAVGAVPPGGALAHFVPISALPPSAPDAVDLFAQGLFFDGGQWQLGPGSLLQILHQDL